MLVVVWENTIDGMGGNFAEPFTIFPEVTELYNKRTEELRKIVAEKKKPSKWQRQS